MTPERMQIWFTDEAPTIGTGLRHVTVERGHKWVHVKGIHGGHKRFRKAECDQIEAATLERLTKPVEYMRRR